MPTYTAMMSMNEKLFFFLIAYAFTVSFSCLIALVSMYSVLLTNSYEFGCPCLVPNLRGKAFSVAFSS